MRSPFSRFVMRLLAPTSIALATVAMVPMAARAQAASSTPSPTVASLLVAEDTRFQAQIRHDVAAVGRAMADELTYTHAVGRIQTKAEYLTAFQNGRAPYRSIVAEGRTARVSGDLGVTHGALKMEVGENRLSSSYLAAYVWRNGRWQLLYWQTSPAPPADSAPPPK